MTTGGQASIMANKACSQRIMCSSIRQVSQPDRQGGSTCQISMLQGIVMIQYPTRTGSRKSTSKGTCYVVARSTCLGPFSSIDPGPFDICHRLSSAYVIAPSGRFADVFRPKVLSRRLTRCSCVPQTGSATIACFPYAFAYCSLFSA